jgi:hypothetical protein
VVQDSAAPWIGFPHPPTGLLFVAPRGSPPITRFERSVEVKDAGAASARLSVRALRRIELWVNDRRVELPAPARHWRQPREVDVSAWLRPGSNRIRAEVANPTGPGLLSLRLSGLPEAVVSDASWSASFDGGAPVPARPIGAEPRNPSAFAMPDPAEGLVARRDLVLGSFAAALLVSLALPRPAAAPWRRRLAAALPALVALGFAGLLLPAAIRIPVEVGFDAHHHVDYVEFLRERRALPLATDGWSMFHPPAYYAPTALLVELQSRLAPGLRAPVAWKLVGGAAGLASALLCVSLARRLFGPGSREASFAGGFAAVLPMNLYISSYVTNESLHATFSCAVALATVSCLMAARPTARQLLGWSVLAALAVLTRYTGWIAAGVGAAFLVAAWWRIEAARPAEIARRGGLLVGVVLALSGWFYARNLVHFGQLFPLNVDLPGATQEWWAPPGYQTPAFFLGFGEVLAHPFLAGAHTAWDSFYSTLWGDGQLAGQMAAGLRHPHWDWELMAAGYWLALPATLLLVAGAAASLRRALFAPAAGERAAHAFLLCFAWTLLLAVLYMTLRQPDYGQAKAFYALAGLAPLAVWFGLGCGGADRWLETRAPAWLRAAFHGWLGCLAAVLWLTYAG